MATTDLLRRSAIAANESRRADSISIRPTQQADSVRMAPRTAQRLAVDTQVQQQGAAAQAFRQQAERAERARAAAPPSALSVGARLGPVVTTGLGATADMSALGTCYRLRFGVAQGAIIADSVQLLNEIFPERSDPTWYRARAAGWPVDTALVWRRVDSTTVVLRSRLASNPLAVRFSIAGLPLPLASESSERVAVAARIRCP